MGLGRILNRTRTIEYTATDLATGSSQSWDLVLGPGAVPSWGGRHYRGGMSIPGAWRAALLISDLLGSMPWDAYRYRAGVQTKLDPTPSLLDQPNPEETRVDTLSAWLLDLLWHGNAVGIIAARDAYGYPTAVLPVPAELVQVGRVGPNAYAGGLPVGQVQYDIGGYTFGSDQVVHIRGPHAPGELRGMGILECHLDGALDLAAEQDRQAGAVSRHGVPTGLLKISDPDATPAETQDVKAKWLTSQRERTVGVLGPGVDFQPLSWNPEELQLIEARKFTLAQIALIFGVPGYFLGAEGASLTYSNVSMEGLHLIRYSLGGHLARMEQTLSQQFPRGTTVKANLDALLRSDTTARYQAHEIGLRAGFLTVPEVRELEDLPPLPDPAPEPPQTNDTEPPALPAAPDAEEAS